MRPAAVLEQTACRTWHPLKAASSQKSVKTTTGAGVIARILVRVGIHSRYAASPAAAIVCQHQQQLPEVREVLARVECYGISTRCAMGAARDQASTVFH